MQIYNQKQNLQKKYMCIYFYDLYCISIIYNKNFVFSGCYMEYSTYHDIVNIEELQHKTLSIVTNKLGIMCKQSKIEDRIRWKIFQNTKLKKFIQIFENIIIYQHLCAIWLSYNINIIQKIINNFCYYFNKFEQNLLNKNFSKFYIEQLNFENISILLEYIFKIKNIKAQKIKTNKHEYQYSPYQIGKSFFINKNTIGIKKQNINTFAIKIKCNENEYNNIIYNIKNYSILESYIQNIKLNILIKTQISNKYYIKQMLLGRNSIINNKQNNQNNNIYIVLT